MILYKFLLLLLMTLQVTVGRAQVEPAVLSKEVSLRLERVPEFKFIREEAAKLGVDVYLFGGSASAFAHYVRWDLEREVGDGKYQKERFDYDFTNIYRGNQDLDIVVDGTAEQAETLRALLQKEYPHFVGNKDAWEVRLLQAKIGDKLPLLDDYDFQNQHTDTNSTGMLALNPGKGEIVFRDLLAWENPESDFLRDVALGRIRFLHSDTHETTSRFQEGKNPPILAAIRYVAKLTQYEVEGRPEDINIIKRIVQETPHEVFSSYVQKKAFEFALKALLNSPDVEKAWKLLEEVGLRQLLMDVDGNQVDSPDTLSWWFNKKPLDSKPLGQSRGALAKDLFKVDAEGDIIVSHETRSFVAYENITRSSKGQANVFISRKGVSGESAAHGDGFYVREGQVGAVGSGLTIRFKLNPLAREGEDFTVHQDFIVIKNKNAVILIQENIELTTADFFDLLIEGDLDDNDLGRIEKIKRRLKRQSDVNLSDEILEILRKLLSIPKGEALQRVPFKTIFSILNDLLEGDSGASFSNSNLQQEAIKLLDTLTLRIDNSRINEHKSDFFRVLYQFSLKVEIKSESGKRDLHKQILIMLKKLNQRLDGGDLESFPAEETLIVLHGFIMRAAGSEDQVYRELEEFYQRLLTWDSKARLAHDGKILLIRIFSRDVASLKRFPEIYEALKDFKNDVFVASDFAKRTLSHPEAGLHLDWINHQILLASEPGYDQYALESIAEHVLPLKIYLEHSEVVRNLIGLDGSTNRLLGEVFSRSWWRERHPDLVVHWLDNYKIAPWVARNIFFQDAYLYKYSAVAVALIKNLSGQKKNQAEFLKELNSYTSSQEDSLIEKSLDVANVIVSDLDWQDSILQYFLTPNQYPFHPFWLNQPEVLERFILALTVGNLKTLVEDILLSEFWYQHPTVEKLISRRLYELSSGIQERWREYWLTRHQTAGSCRYILSN